MRTSTSRLPVCPALQAADAAENRSSALGQECRPKRFRVEFLRAACAAIMVLVVVQLAVSGAKAETALRVLTWDMTDADVFSQQRNPSYLRSAARTSRRDTLRRDARITRGAAGLNGIADQLDADIIALQGAETPQAVRRVFSARDYHLVFSRQLLLRYAQNRRVLSDPDLRQGYTAIAFRRTPGIRLLEHHPIMAMAYPDPDRPGQQTSAGLAARVLVHGLPLWLLVVDLHDTCAGSTDESRNTVADNRTAVDVHDDDVSCLVLREQARQLAVWIEARLSAGERVIVAGSLGGGIDDSSRATAAQEIRTGFKEAVDGIERPAARTTQSADEAIWDSRLRRPRNWTGARPRQMVRSGRISQPVSSSEAPLVGDYRNREHRVLGQSVVVAGKADPQGSQAAITVSGQRPSLTNTDKTAEAPEVSDEKTNEGLLLSALRAFFLGSNKEAEHTGSARQASSVPPQGRVGGDPTGEGAVAARTPNRNNPIQTRTPSTEEPAKSTAATADIGTSGTANASAEDKSTAPPQRIHPRLAMLPRDETPPSCNDRNDDVSLPERKTGAAAQASLQPHIERPAKSVAEHTSRGDTSADQPSSRDVRAYLLVDELLVANGGQMASGRVAVLASASGQPIGGCAAYVDLALN